MGDSSRDSDPWREEPAQSSAPREHDLRAVVVIDVGYEGSVGGTLAARGRR